MIYTLNNILSMDEQTFYSTFFESKVKVLLKDNSIIEGFVERMSLSSIVNPCTKDNLPTEINVNGQNIWLANICKIEKL